jgi:hypothetical protein
MGFGGSRRDPASGRSQHGCIWHCLPSRWLFGWHWVRLLPQSQRWRSSLTSYMCLLPQRTAFRVFIYVFFHQGTGCIWSSLGPAHRTLYHVPRRPPEGNLWNKFLPQWVKWTHWMGMEMVLGQIALLVPNFDTPSDPQLPHCNWQWWQYLQSVGPSTAALRLYYPCPSEFSDWCQVWA